MIAFQKGLKIALAHWSALLPPGRDIMFRPQFHCSRDCEYERNRTNYREPLPPPPPPPSNRHRFIKRALAAHAHTYTSPQRTYDRTNLKITENITCTAARVLGWAHWQSWPQDIGKWIPKIYPIAFSNTFPMSCPYFRFLRGVIVVPRRPNFNQYKLFNSLSLVH